MSHYNFLDSIFASIHSSEICDIDSHNGKGGWEMSTTLPRVIYQDSDTKEEWILGELTTQTQEPWKHYQK